MLDRCTLKDTDYRKQRIDLVRWIARYLTDDFSRVKGKGGIKKATLYFAAKFQFMVVHFRLCLTVSDNMLTWDRVVLVASLLVGNKTDFMALIKLEIHEHDFGENTTLLFPYLIQQLYDAAGVLDIPDIDRRIEVKCTVDISLIKDRTNLILAQRSQAPLEIILVHFEGAPSSIKNVDRLDIDFDIYMGEQRDVPEVATKLEEDPAISTPASTAIFELIMASNITPHLISISIGFIGANRAAG